MLVETGADHVGHERVGDQAPYLAMCPNAEVRAVDLDVACMRIVDVDTGTPADDAVVFAVDRGHGLPDARRVARMNFFFELVEVDVALLGEACGGNRILRSADDRRTKRNDLAYIRLEQARGLTRDDTAKAPADQRQRNPAQALVNVSHALAHGPRVPIDMAAIAAEAPFVDVVTEEVEVATQWAHGRFARAVAGQQQDGATVAARRTP